MNRLDWTPRRAPRHQCEQAQIAALIIQQIHEENRIEANRVILARVLRKAFWLGVCGGAFCVSVLVLAYNLASQ